MARKQVPICGTCRYWEFISRPEHNFASGECRWEKRLGLDDSGPCVGKKWEKSGS